MTGDGVRESSRAGGLRDLLIRSLLRSQENDADISQVLTKFAESETQCQTVGILAAGTWRAPGRGLQPADLAAIGAGPRGGQVTLANAGWAWAYPIPAADGQAGYLLAAAAGQPPPDDRRLLEEVAQLAGLVLAGDRQRERILADLADLRVANLALRQSMAVHDRLTQVTMRGEGQEGIARAVHELTGHPAGIEDAFGNIVSWAGADRPDLGHRDARVQARLLQRVRAGQGAVRDGARLVSVAWVAGAALGLVVLADPDKTAGHAERAVVEYATIALAMEIARLQGLDESLARVRASLVLDLVNGEEEATALSRAQALGYDLRRPHRVVVVECRADSGPDMEQFSWAVRRAARGVGAGSLLASRPGDVIILTDAEVSWQVFHAHVETEAHGLPCSAGVGGQCHEVADFPRSHREAQLALRIQEAVGKTEQVTVFDDLGVYQLLATEADTSAMESFVRDWLGSLLDYDGVHGTELTRTLTEFLGCGGSYADTARVLLVHRSTLKYRLRRIREVSGHDMGAPEVQFNLQVATRAWRTLQALRQH